MFAYSMLQQLRMVLRYHTGLLELTIILTFQKAVSSFLFILFYVFGRRVEFKLIITVRKSDKVLILVRGPKFSALICDALFAFYYLYEHCE